MITFASKISDGPSLVKVRTNLTEDPRSLGDVGFTGGYREIFNAH